MAIEHHRVELVAAESSDKVGVRCCASCTIQGVLCAELYLGRGWSG